MRKKKKDSLLKRVNQGRRVWMLTIIILLILAGISWRMVDLTLSEQQFLQHKSDARTLRNIEVLAHRGMISDRNNEPLAISTPVISVWATPAELLTQDKQSIELLADRLKLNRSSLKQLLNKRSQQSFVYLRRRISPLMAEQVKTLKLKGVYFQTEYRRFYPTAEASGHILGFTDIDEKGIEGLELVFDESLKGESGKQQVIKNMLGQIIALDDLVVPPKAGQDIQLSIDSRIQYLAYAGLKETITKHQAVSGSAVILDVQSGEVIAMVNQPGFNPNKTSHRVAYRYKNRALTDLYEPGSTVKPFSILAALQSGQYKPTTIIETGNGHLLIGEKEIRDTRAHGSLTVSGVLQKSSNVGTAKIAMNLPPDLLWDVFADFGFGLDTGSMFYGETSGKLSRTVYDSKVIQASLSFGYGLSVSTLQLANAYATIARQGEWKPVTFIKGYRSEQMHRKVAVDSKYIRQVIAMMERVVKPGGTAPKAAISGYRVAGKTGTAKKFSKQGGYTADKYIASFVGFAPVSRPRFVVAVTVNEPKIGGYYGGVVAAPLFTRLMKDALRLHNVSPDNLDYKTSAENLRQQLPATQEGMIH